MIHYVFPLFAAILLNGFTYAADPNDFVVYTAPGVPGQLYVPPGSETSETPRPLILFLHGAGETGTNNTSQINANMDNLLNAAKERDAFLYAPQATTTPGGIYNWDDTVRTDTVISMIFNAIAKYNVDPERIYVTGLSMGGGGTWNMGSRYANRFAAAVPIAGVLAGTDFDPSEMIKTPTWAFHARNDPTITKDRSRDRINELLEVAGQPTIDTFPANNDNTTLFEFEFTDDTTDVQYTELPTGGHGIWGNVYNTPEVYDWMFAQRYSGDGLAARPGDLNGDFLINAKDLDQLISVINDGSNDLLFDLNGTETVGFDDREFWLTTYKQSLVGDANLDGIVDSADLNAVGVNWQSATAIGWADGDFNGDGNVNSTDLNEIGIHWREQGAQEAMAATVPEPTGMVLLMLAALTGLGRLTRR